MSEIRPHASGGGVDIRWHTLLDIDFTTQSTQTLTPDGNYTIGGFTFAKTWTAQEVNPTVLTNGTGIVVEPTAASDNWNATQNFPRLAINLAANIADFSPSTRTRIWMRATGNYSSSYDSAILQFQHAAEGHNIAWEFTNVGGFGNRRHAQTTFWNTSREPSVAGLAIGSYDVSVIDCNGLGLGSIQDQVTCYSGTWAGSWPTVAALVPTYTWSFDRTWAVFQHNAESVVAGWDVAVGASRNGGTAGFKATIQALKIEYVVVTS